VRVNTPTNTPLWLRAVDGQVHRQDRWLNARGHRTEYAQNGLYMFQCTDQRVGEVKRGLPFIQNPFRPPERSDVVCSVPSRRGVDFQPGHGALAYWSLSFLMISMITPTFLFD